MTAPYVRWTQRIASLSFLLSYACAARSSAPTQASAASAQQDAGSRLEDSSLRTGLASAAGAGGEPAAAAVAGAAAESGTGSTADDASRPPEQPDGPKSQAGSAGKAAETSQTPGAEEEATVDSEGCPINLEGFASVRSEAASGTTGGRAGETVTVSTHEALARYAEAEEPYVIRVAGALMLSPKGTEIEVASHKTILGVGDSAEIVAGGFRLTKGVHNVIIRNLTVHGTFAPDDWEGKTQDHDGVQLDTAHHVWIDHCHFHHIGDGMIDSRKDSSFLTVSWNILSDHNKAFGIGWSENVTAELSIHHNWLRDTNQRNPSTDNVLHAHLYNNWLQRIASYGNYARGGTHMVLENSVFDTVKDPHWYETGSLVAIDNQYTGTSGRRESSGTTYGEFDPHTFYAYTLTPTADVTTLLTRCAGPRPTLGQ